MKKALLLLSLFAATVFAAGCETTQTNAAAEKSDAEVITGSRIPRKGGGSDGSVSTMGGGQIDRSGTGAAKGK